MSLRARVLWGWGAVVVLLIVAGLVLIITQRSVLVGQIDDRLANVTKTAVKVARSDTALGSGGGIEARIPPVLSGLYVGILAPDGTLTTLATPTEDAEFTPIIAGPLAPGVPTTVPTAASSPGGMRVVEIPANGEGIIVLGAPLDGVQSVTTRLAHTLLLMLAVCLLVIGAILFWVLRLGLQPITRVTQIARAIGAGDTTQRVAAFPVGTEAQELSQAFNLLVDANIASEQRLRRFVADASHELRTPLATLTGYTSLYAAGGLTDHRALDDAMTRIRQEAGRMQLLIADLFLLAELDQGPVLAHEPVDLAPVLEGLAADLRVLAPDRHVSLQSPEHLPVVGDAQRLTQALAVLTSNALRHTPPGTPIHLRATTGEGRTRIEVIDEGPGIHEADRSRIFDRFYRADTARARGTGGTGLGLSIAAAIITAHDGHIGVQRNEPCGTAFWIELASS